MERIRVGAWAGVLSGIGLAVEATFFMASGWSAEAFSTLGGAVAVMSEGGHLLRLAAVFGVLNLAFLTLFFAGLAAYIARKSPELGGAVVYFGVIGIAIHAIVPIGFYQAVPAFQGIVEQDGAGASWHAFEIILSIAQATGTLFMGLAMLAAGIATLFHRLLPAGLGVVALLAGAAGVLSALAAATPLATVIDGLAMTGILLSIIFRTWGGLALGYAADPMDSGQAASNISG